MSDVVLLEVTELLRHLVAAGAGFAGSIAPVFLHAAARVPRRRCATVFLQYNRLIEFIRASDSTLCLGGDLVILPAGHFTCLAGQGEQLLPSIQ